MEDHITVFIHWGIRLVSSIFILIAGWVIGNWVDRRVERMKRIDETLKGFLGGLAKYSIFIIALITVLGQFGVQTASLLAVLGAAGLAIGLALQGTLSNVAAGSMLLVLRPFRVGDYIMAGGIAGTVKTLGLFGTELSTADNVYIFLPNSRIWNADIWNYTRNHLRRQDVNFSISYSDDIGKALRVVNDILTQDSRIVQTPDDKKPQVLTSDMADFSVKMIARFWCGRDDYWTLKWDVTKAIKETLDREGITIPFPTQTVIERKSG